MKFKEHLMELNEAETAFRRFKTVDIRAEKMLMMKAACAVIMNNFEAQMEDPARTGANYVEGHFYKSRKVKMGIVKGVSRNFEPIALSIEAQFPDQDVIGHEFTMTLQLFVKVGRKGNFDDVYTNSGLIAYLKKQGVPEKEK